MKNAWQMLCGEDVKKTMLLLGVKQMYSGARASDFEKFSAWCSGLCMLEDNLAAEQFAQKISELTGVEMSVRNIFECSPSALWKMCAERINVNSEGVVHCVEKDNNISCRFSKYYCDENNNISDEYVSADGILSSCVEQGIYDFEKIKNTLEISGNIPLYLSFGKGEFCRPNVFCAAEELKKISNGEKYNKNEILCQLMLEKIYSNKSRKMQSVVYIQGEVRYVRSLIEYIKLRELSIRIFFVSDTETPANELAKICALSADDCFITPVLTCLAQDGEQKIKDYVNSLKKIYPKGLIKTGSFC